MDSLGRIDWQQIGLVLLAAGRGERFGGDKLAADLCGRPVLAHAAGACGAIPFARRVAVLGAGLPDLPGFTSVRPAAPDQPQSRSLAAGVAQLGTHGLEAIMVVLGDMPLVTPAHLDALRCAFDGRRPVCSHGAAKGPPALFPVTWHDTLLAQTGDRGARALLLEAVAVEGAHGELIDIDRPEDLARAAALLG